MLITRKKIEERGVNIMKLFKRLSKKANLYWTVEKTNTATLC